MASRVPRALAQRIDRASRAAHLFHRYAHHPLCGRYQTELVSLGRRVRVCRGCTLIAVGLVVGVAVGLLVRGRVAPLPLWAAALTLVAVGERVLRVKTVSRFLPALAIGMAGPASLPAAAGSLGVLLGLRAAYRRRKPNRAACLSCPERTEQVCSGVRPIVLRERAFGRLSGRWLQEKRILRANR
jgi:hypothetical protein